AALGRRFSLGHCPARPWRAPPEPALPWQRRRAPASARPPPWACPPARNRPGSASASLRDRWDSSPAAGPVAGPWPWDWERPRRSAPSAPPPDRSAHRARAYRAARRRGALPRVAVPRLSGFGRRARGPYNSVPPDFADLLPRP